MSPVRNVAAFQLLKLDASGFRPFSELCPHRVAAMMRRVTSLAAEAAGRPAEWVRLFVLGHGSGPQSQAQGNEGLNRFSYLPLPSLEARRGGNSRVVSSIRRVLVVEPPGGTGEHAAWARRALSGRELLAEPDASPVALLGLLPESDKSLRPYLAKAEAWSTVTPVVLNGHDDGKPRKVEKMLRRAIEQAGFPRALADNAELEWRRVGFRPGADLATRYAVPDHLQSRPRYHVWLRWRGPGGQGVSLAGPVALGDGRYCGLGLFAAHPADTRP
jgi:CRISPR-associated protein Csb2